MKVFHSLMRSPSMRETICGVPVKAFETARGGKNLTKWMRGCTCSGSKIKMARYVILGREGIQSSLLLGDMQSGTSGFVSLHARSLHIGRPLLATVTFKLADIGEGIAQVELLKWHKKEGDRMEEMEAVCDVQSDKAAVEITSRYTGTIVKLVHKVGDMINIGDALLTIDVEDDTDSQENAASPTSAATPPKTQEGTATKFSRSDVADGAANAVPSARRLAKELGVDLSLVKGSGKGGRISKEDVENFFSKSGGSPLAGTSAPAASPVDGKPTTHSTTTGLTRPQKENRVVQLRGFGRAMVKSMSESAKVPHLNIGDEIDVTSLLEMRSKIKPIIEKEFGTKLSITTLIVKAVSLALIKHAALNSRLMNDSEYTIYGSHNISMAIDTSNGLVVPNIKNVQDLSIMEIQAALSHLQQLAQSNKLSSGDLTGGTVCVSNVGVIAGTYVKPLLFDGQAVIIGIGKLQKVPKFNSRGEIAPRLIMNFGISADHRHMDGATVARFMAELKCLLEDPELMLLAMR